MAVIMKNVALILLLWIKAGLTAADDVTQTSSLWKTEGEDATMDCSHTKTVDYNQMYWFQQLPGGTMMLVVFTAQGKKNHDFGSFNTSKFSATKPNVFNGSFTVRRVEPQDQGVYFCAVRTGYNFAEAYFGKGTKLTVLEPKRDVTLPTVKLIKPSEEECRNQKDNRRKKTLVCVASGFYPDHVSVSWEQNGEEVKDGVATDTAALRPEKEDYYKISSRLRVSADTWFNPETEFTCIVKFFDGTNYINETATVNGDPAPVKHSLTREKYLKISQSAKLSYIVFIAKSCVYGVFVAFLLYKLQRSAGKLSR